MKDYDLENILHITAGTAIPSTTKVDNLDSALDISHELNLLKAAILYADQVKFCSLAATSLLPLINRPANMSENEKLEWFLDFYKKIGDESLIKEITEFKESHIESKRHRRQNYSYYLQHQIALEKSLRKMDERATKAKLSELIAAVNSSIVEFKPFIIGYRTEDFFKEVSAALASLRCAVARCLNYAGEMSI